MELIRRMKNRIGLAQPGSAKAPSSAAPGRKRAHEGRTSESRRKLRHEQGAKRWAECLARLAGQQRATIRRESVPAWDYCFHMRPNSQRVVRLPTPCCF